MSDFNNQWIEIFRAGDYGDKGKWPPERVKQVVENFKPATWQPPAVLGHPQHDAPAMAQVAELREEGGILSARFQNVHTALESLVAEGRYPNRSAAFYLDPQDQGPVLRHVGFLGGQPPEVKGLAPIQFSGGDFVTVDFKEDQVSNDNHEQIKKTVAESIKAFFRESFSAGGNHETKTLSESAVADRIAEAVKGATAEFGKQMETFKTEFTEAQEKAKEREGALGEKARKSEVAAFIEKQKAANRWVPAFDKAGLGGLLEIAAASDGKITFGEGDKKTEVGVFEAFQKFLEQLPKIVPLGELAGAGRHAGSGGENVIYMEPARSSGYAVDPESVALAELAQKVEGDIRKEFPNADAGKVAGLALDRARKERAAGSGGGISAGAG